MIFKNEAAAREAGLKPGEGYELPIPHTEKEYHFTPVPQGWAPTVVHYETTSTYVKWRKEDLDPNDRVTFTPEEIPNWRSKDVDGKKYMIFEVNGLECLLILDEPNTVNRIFFNAYEDSRRQAIEVEQFKRDGPKWRFWRSDNYNAGTWTFDPEVKTAWLDQNGHYLNPNETYTISTEPGTEGMPMTAREMQEHKTWQRNQKKPKPTEPPTKRRASKKRHPKAKS